MFTYWNGYEIDGSSTTYNIVLPQQGLVAEVLSYILSLKIVDRNAEIVISYSVSNDDPLRKPVKKKKSFKFDQMQILCDTLESPGIREFFVDIYCIHPDKLYPQVRKELFELSKSRPGAKNSVYNYKNPTINPFYYQSTFNIWISGSFIKKEKAVEEYEPEGLIFNEKSLVNNMKSNHLTIDLGCGPGFIYEYAAFILEKMAERFPEVGIDGGIDCAGGFVDGCTYACSLYSYERITLDTESISLTINQILQEGIIIPQKRAGKYGQDHVKCSDLSLFHLYNIDKWDTEHADPKSKIIKGIAGKEHLYSPEEYEQFAKKVSQIELFDSIDMIHYCTSRIMIGENPCALTCIKEDGCICLELRVVSKVREELVKKLSRCGFAVK